MLVRVRAAASASATTPVATPVGQLPSMSEVPQTLFRRTLDGLHAAGQARHARGLRGLHGKLSFAGWMLLRTATHSQAQGHVMSALWRLCVWQLWRKLPQAGAIAELPNGEQLWCPPWSHLAGAWLSVGYHESELLFAWAFLREGDLVLDVGANIGVYTVVAARKGARVVAFEPNPEARATLHENLILNEIDDEVRISPNALADFSGPARFTTNLEECNHLNDVAAGAGELVTVRELDSLEWVDKPVTLIKIDVEGFDEAVLRGARRTLLRDRPVLIIETWAGGSSIRELLASLGYSFFTFQGRTLRSLPRVFTQDANLVAIHAERLAWVETRLASQPIDLLRGPRARWVRRRDWARRSAPG